MEDIYLCTKFNNIGKYNCKRFDDYKKATEYFRFFDKKDLKSSIMIPVFKFYPRYMKLKYLEYKLSKIFCKVELE
jgi:hypothetical protein